MAVAPLVLCKYFSVSASATVSLWFSLVAMIWAFMAPGLSEGERSPDARRRFLGGAFSDPFVWASIVLVGYSALIALNPGVGLAYDPEASVWRLAVPRFPSVPGCASGAGFAPFAAAVAVFAVYPAAVYSLASGQTMVFASAAVAVLVVDAVYSIASGTGFTGSSASAYGLWAMVSAAVMLSASRGGRRFAELLSMLALAVCFAAVLLSGVPSVACVFAAGIVIALVVFACFSAGSLHISGICRVFVLTAVAFAVAAAVFRWRGGDFAALVPSLGSAADSVLNRLALRAWEAKPWLGVGVGAFPVAAKIGAEAADWSVLGAAPDFLGNAWRVFLTERGMIGAVVLAACTGTVFRAWLRCARMRGRALFTAAVPLLPIACVVLAVSLVFDGSGFGPDAVLAFASLAALSVNGGT